MSDFTKGQYCQLIEIEAARMRDGKPGLREPFQQFLDYLKIGGDAWELGLVIKTPDDYFSHLLRRHWNCLGHPLGLAKTFEQYQGLWPVRPSWESAIEIPGHLRMILLPVHPAIPVVDLCGGFRITYGGDNDTFVPWDEAVEVSHPHWREPHWMWCQPGPFFFNHMPSGVRAEDCAPKEFPSNATEGVHIWGLTGPYPFVTDCPRSVHRGGRQHCACLKLFFDGPGLRWYGDDSADPRCGSGSRWE